MKKKELKLAGKGVLLAMAGVLTLTAADITAEACTSYYAGKDVTADGSIMFGRTEDISASHSKIFKVYEAATHEEGEMYKDVTSFTMPLPKQTWKYTVCEDDPGYGGDLFGEVGTNEKGVSMTATESASPTQAITDVDPFVDTGITESSMLNAVLPCVSTARDGVEYLANILDTYGAGEGNTLMIGDQEECWYMEILSGHQYAAIKMPDDKAAIMPNCFMIEDIDVADTENVIASKDLIKTAKAAEAKEETAASEEETTVINVKKSYAGAMKESNSYRIWGGQIIFNPDLKETTTPTQAEYDMFVTPKEKVTVQTMYKIAGTQYEGTEYYGGTGRVIGGSSTCESHLFQVRKDMPTELATLEWLAMGSADLSPFIPYYSAAITDTLPAYKVGEVNYNEDSAYWTFRSLAALSTAAESRELAAVKVKEYWTNYVDSLVNAQAGVDQKMTELYNTDQAAVSAKATNLGMAVAQETIGAAKQTYNELLARVARGNGMVTAVRGQGFVPSLLTAEKYSDYRFDMVYEPEADVSAENTQLKNDLKEANKQLATAKEQQTTALDSLKAEQKKNAELQVKLAELQKVQPVEKTAIKTNKASYTVKKGKKVTMKVTVTNAQGKKVTYKTANAKIAKVTSKGVIKGVKKGKTSIKISCNGVTKNVKVIVK